MWRNFDSGRTAVPASGSGFATPSSILLDVARIVGAANHDQRSVTFDLPLSGTVVRDQVEIAIGDRHRVRLGAGAARLENQEEAETPHKAYKSAYGHRVSIGLGFS